MGLIERHFHDNRQVINHRSPSHITVEENRAASVESARYYEEMMMKAEQDIVARLCSTPDSIIDFEGIWFQHQPTMKITVYLNFSINGHKFKITRDLNSFEIDNKKRNYANISTFIRTELTDIVSKIIASELMSRIDIEYIERNI